MNPFSSYQNMLSKPVLSCLHRALQSLQTKTTTRPMSVDMGLPAACLMVQDDPALHDPFVAHFKTLGQMGHLFSAEQTASPKHKPPPALADQAGHRRPIYLPLVIHLHLSAFGRCYETLSTKQWSACEDALPNMMHLVGDVQQYSQGPPPRDQIDLALWQAMCIHQQSQLLKRDTDQEWVDAVVHHVLANPGQDGAIHSQQPEESLDAWTYRELCALHALSLLALSTRHKAWSKRVNEAALYHLERTQPDHTTDQPWALFAFAWSDQTASFAQQQIHDTGIGDPSKPAEPLMAMLLADHLASFAAFESAPVHP